MGAAVTQIAGALTTNLSNLVSEDTVLLVLIDVLGVALVAPNAAVAAALSTADDFIAAVQTGDFVTALSDVINTPAIVTGAFLNGFTPGSSLGILAADGGVLTNPITGNMVAYRTIQSILEARNTIAAAITPPVMMLSTLAKSTAPTAPSALPNLATNTVTVNTAKTLNTGPADPPSATGANAGPVAKVTTGKVTTTTGTTSLTGGNTGGNGTKATGNQLSSTLSKITAGLTKGTSPTAKTGTHK